MANWWLWSYPGNGVISPALKQSHGAIRHNTDPVSRVNTIWPPLSHPKVFFLEQNNYLSGCPCIHPNSAGKKARICYTVERTTDYYTCTSEWNDTPTNCRSVFYTHQSRADWWKYCPCLVFACSLGIRSLLHLQHQIFQLCNFSTQECHCQILLLKKNHRKTVEGQEYFKVIPRGATRDRHAKVAAHALISVYPLDHNITQAPLSKKRSPPLLPNFFKSKDTREVLFYCHLIDEIIEIW